MSIKNYGFDKTKIVETMTIAKDKHGFIRQTIEHTNTQSNDVFFIDYDGTVLYSYKASTFLQMRDMPKNPTHDGLISRGWNWSYEDAQAYVQKYGKLNIGQMYAPADGKTHIKIHIPEWGSYALELCFTQTMANGVIVDWGDGSETDTSDVVDGPAYLEHIYTNDTADYEITIKTIDGCELGYGYDNGEENGYISFYNNSQSHATLYATYMTELIIADSVTSIGRHAFDNCIMLQTLVIPDSVVHIGKSAFSLCYELKSLNVPNSVTSIGESSFGSCYLLQWLTIPNSVLNIDASAFIACHNLYPSLTIPDSVTNIGASSFNNCRALQYLIIPDSMNNISNQSFQNCVSLQYINIPDTVEDIGMFAFANCINLRTLVLPESITSMGMRTFMCPAFYRCIIKCIIPPTIANNTFEAGLLDSKFLVPAESVDAYKAAEGWSTYAEQIFAMEEE